MGIQTSTINSGPVAGFKNKIINGNFDIWQRGTSSVTWVAPINSYYLCDRWLSQVGGTGGAGALSRQAFTVGQSEVPNNPTYFLRLNVTSAASGQVTGNNYLEQRIEDVTTLAGQQVTVSFWARGSGTLPGVFLSQTFGTGGSAQVNQTLVSNLALSGGTTGAWTKYTYTTTLPSVSGKTVGTSSYVNLTFQLPLNAIYQIDVAQVQVEQGPVATAFEQRPQQTELGLCMRYYEHQLYPAFYGWTIANDFQYRSWSGVFAVSKRVQATVTVSGGNIVPSTISTSGGAWSATQASLGAATGYYFTNVIASAEL